MNKQFGILLVLLFLLMLPPAALADTTQNIVNGISVQRIYGQERYQTSIAIADQVALKLGIDFSKGQQFQAVVLASGNNWPDAISGTTLAKVNKAPILLLDSTTDAKGSQETFSYIQQHVSTGAKVFILGGFGVIPEEFTQHLIGMGFLASNIQQTGGANRDETSFMIAKTLPNCSALTLVSDQNYYDALSAGPPQTDRDGGISTVLLIPEDGAVSKEEKDFISQHSSVSAIGAICNIKDTKSVFNIGSWSVTINGGSEYATNSEVAMGFPTIFVASGEDYPDALAGSVLSGEMEYSTGGPTYGATPILVKRDSIPPESLRNLKKSIPTSEGGGVKNIIVFGGTGAVSDLVVSQLVNLILSPSVDRITAFKFSNNPNIVCNIASDYILADVPTDTDVTALIPDITVSDGATVSPSSGVLQNFTNPVTYTVTASDGTTHSYSVDIRRDLAPLGQ